MIQSLIAGRYNPSLVDCYVLCYIVDFLLFPLICVSSYIGYWIQGIVVSGYSCHMFHCQQKLRVIERILNIWGKWGAAYLEPIVYTPFC